MIDISEHLVSARQIKCSKGEHDFISRKLSDGWHISCQNCNKPMRWADSTPILANVIMKQEELIESR